MNKENIQEKAVQYAVGTLPEEELEQFEAHLRDDRELQTAVHEWQTINEMSALDCPQVEPSFRVYSELMQRIDQEEAAENENQTEVSDEGKLIPFWSWGGWAVAACAAVVFGFLVFENREAVSGDVVLTELGKPGDSRNFVVDQETITMEDRMLELAGLAEAYWYSRIEERDIAQSQSEAATEGFSLFDRNYKIGFMAVENLPEEHSGKTYHVWARSEGSDKSVRAGTIPIGGASDGLFFFDLSENKEIDFTNSSISFFVTEETANSPKTPEGRIVLGGI